MSLNIQFLENEIIDQYLYDDNPTRPWIIGFSGGKDSTLLLQLVWNALSKLESAVLSRDVYVVCNDTLVENPKIVQFIEKTLKRIQKAAVEQSLPIKVHQTTPRLEDTFWINLIGKGYPVPSNSFRWCTERLKISPTSRFILEKIGEKGEAIILLGTRASESSQRSRSLKKYSVHGQRLRKHVLQNAFVYSPLTDITTDELWQYLLQSPPPWGGTHRNLITLYKNATGGDCPLVIDDTTPSCGNSRFGCWVCTVVKRDKSMEFLVENGEDWMFPLIEFRELLVESRNREGWRENVGRNGKPRPNETGPYKEFVRALFLEKLLQAQKEIQETQSDVELISHQELVAIQITWYRDGLFKHKVSDIYNSIYKTNWEMGKHEEKFRKEEDLLKKSCGINLNDFDLIQELLALQKTKTLMLRKRGLQNDIENRLEEFIKENKN